MHAGWARWEQWQKEREADKECYKVVDPRQREVIAQELAMQKKVLAAYKATRARKKMARQKAREMKAKNGQDLNPGLRMETVQEGEEALGGEGEDEDESDDEFGQFGSDMSDDDVGETVEVDDPMELLWSAFSQADTEGRGLLSIAQTRLGVVNVLGIGVTANEVTEALVRFKVPYPFNVSFDLFADLVAFFRSGEEDNSDSEQGSHVPSLKTMAPAQRKGLGTPRGSAAQAIRARHQDSGSMSC
ncbi:Rhamnolipids biosynthesis 3-oxoacyl- reductase [Phytophthora cinnamomi]|uniref:Rhamnolipids biosynthesis 3-oxoacyl- reductase n=1 Tax=Phytophthora cinnamomi TaxID=4785 RepID=UPI003559B945|nr:Rhamnolipids biosynthesis 3-oxoacyl- reductase [Phytophthora cinnamomi]